MSCACCLVIQASFVNLDFAWLSAFASFRRSGNYHLTYPGMLKIIRRIIMSSTRSHSPIIADGHVPHSLMIKRTNFDVRTNKYSRILSKHRYMFSKDYIMPLQQV
jgi:hypothetical protein